MGKGGGSVGVGYQNENSAQTQQVDAHPLVEETMARVLNAGMGTIGNTPQTPEYYGGDMVAGMDSTSARALNQMAERGLYGSDTERAANNYVQNMLGGDAAGDLRGAAGAFMAGLPQAYNTLGGLAQGGMGLDAANAFAQGGASPFGDALAAAAGGQVNPLTGQMFQQAAGNLAESFNESTVPAINSAFSMHGRTGSGAHADAMGNAAGELADAQAGLAAQMFGGASESALNRGLSAAQAGLSDDMSRRGLAAGLYNAGADRALQAGGQMLGGASTGFGGLGNLAGLQGSAAGLTNMLSGLDFQNLGAAVQAGDRFQGQQQQEIDADMARYDYNANRGIQDYDRMMQNLGAVTGLTGGLAGTGTTQTDASGNRVQAGGKKGG